MTYYKSIRLSFDKMPDFIGRHPYLILIAILIITVVLALHIPSLSFRTSIYDLVVEELDESRVYEKFQGKFGSEEIIRIVVKTKNVFDPIVFNQIERISAQSSDIDGVRRVISLPNIKKAMEKGKEWSLEEFSSLIKPIDLFKRNLISNDYQTTAITLVLSIEADKEAVIESVDEIISNKYNSRSLYQIGMPNVSKALAEYTKKDFLRLPPVTLILMTIILFLLFRNLNCLFLPFSCVILSLVWTLGLMALTGVSLSLLTMVVPVFLIAVGSAYCIHVCSEYMASARILPTSGEVMRRTLSKMSLPVFLATITTVIGIGSLMINRINAIREFALFTCFGMLSLMILIFTFLPVMMQLLTIPKEKEGFAFIDRFVDGILKQVIRINLFRQKACLIIVGLITLFCGVGIFFIQVETNPVEFFKKDTKLSRNFHDIYSNLSGSFPVSIVMAGNAQDYFENPEHIQGIVRLQDYCETLPGIDKTVSFADYLKLVNYMNNQYDPEYYTLPHKPYQVRILINNFKSLLGDDVFSSFMDPNLSTTNILMLSHVSSSRDFLTIKKNILDHAKESFSHDLIWDVTGLGIVISASSHLLTSGQVKSVLVSLSLIFCVMVMLFLSGKVGFLAMVPNCFPIIVNFGLIGWLGLELSTVTSLIACIAIGLAVDDTIHYLVRYNSEFKKDLDKDRALRDTLMSVGRPIIFSSVTIGLGFSILIFSHFQPTSVFGILMVVTMLSALVGDLILLPALMLRVELMERA